MTRIETSKVFYLFNVLLVTICIYFCVSAFYKITKTIFGQKLYASLSHSYNKQLHDHKSKPFEKYKKIIDRNLFNINKQSGQIDSLSETENLPETKLKLKLWGTVIGGLVKAYAVIEEIESKTQNLYREGDKIQKATVVRILRGMVVLRINGRDEILEMENVLKNKLASSPESIPDNEISAEDGQYIEIDRHLIDKAIEDRVFFSSARIVPDFGNPNTLGLRITEINPDSLIAQIGIKDGDIITSLDGKRFRKTSEAIAYYKSVPSSKEMKLEVVRNGQKIAINYGFK